VPTPSGQLVQQLLFMLLTILDKLQMVLDGGDCQNGIESTIIGFENEDAVLYE
jgi:tRNA A37 threonylcarbamoyladenosine synthetase subunit TsaC/SUA5/YrdC